MKGFIFEYYKYLRYPGKSLDDMSGCMERDMGSKSILTFGEYDRLEINVITEINRYRDLSGLAKEWLGNRQSILLYELSNDTKVRYEVEDKRPVFKWKDKSGTECNDRHLFWALTIFPFQNYLRKTDYDALLGNAANGVKAVVKAHIEKMQDAEIRFDTCYWDRLECLESLFCGSAISTRMYCNW